MKNPTPFLPGIHFSFLRRSRTSHVRKYAAEQEQLARSSFSQLRKQFADFIPESVLSSNPSKAFSRRRIFTKENTFWAFFSQILDADGGCRETVRRLQAAAAANGVTVPGSSTAAYCKARAKLKSQCLQDILTHTAETLENQTTRTALSGRRVVVVDGTGVSMPDTPANQQQWPQPAQQKPGCGFPQTRILACFDLASGAHLAHALGNKRSQELRLLEGLWDTLDAGDIVLADKGFCSYFDIANLQSRRVDSVISLARRTPVTAADAVAVLGPDDLLIEWPRPKWTKNLRYSRAQSQALPERLLLRQLKITVKQPGFRSTSFYIVTTLTDSIRYPAAELADLYYQRWDVELFFRDIKTTMGMDIVRCKSPDLVVKEITMHFIVYNSIRLLMLRAAMRSDIPVRRISFKASMQALRQWEPHFNQCVMQPHELRRLMDQLLDVIAGACLSSRPGRSEPRCVKRRPKPFQLMTQPRSLMREAPHRGRICSKRA